MQESMALTFGQSAGTHKGAALADGSKPLARALQATIHTFTLREDEK